MPSFDVVSEINTQELRNAVDQTAREVSNRFDFKDTNSSITFDDKAMTITLETSSEDRMIAFQQVLEEKLVKRQVSLKTLDIGPVEEASGARARVKIDLRAGVSSDMAKQINTTIKNMKLKGVQSQTQGEQIRVSGKKRDDLQKVIATLKESDLDLPLQFQNFRD